MESVLPHLPPPALSSVLLFTFVVIRWPALPLVAVGDDTVPPLLAEYDLNGDEDVDDFAVGGLLLLVDRGEACPIPCPVLEPIGAGRDCEVGTGDLDMGDRGLMEYLDVYPVGSVGFFVFVETSFPMEAFKVLSKAMLFVPSKSASSSRAISKESYKKMMNKSVTIKIILVS